MSLLLIVLTVLLALTLYWRIRARTLSAMRTWAAGFGYRIVSFHFETVRSEEFQEAGRAADVVYRAVLESPAGDRLTAYFLIWNLLWGRPEVIVRWTSDAAGDGGVA